MPTNITLSVQNQKLLQKAKEEIKDLSAFFEQMLAIHLGPTVEIIEEDLLPETRKWMGIFKDETN